MRGRNPVRVSQSSRRARTRRRIRRGDRPEGLSAQERVDVVVTKAFDMLFEDLGHDSEEAARKISVANAEAADVG